MGNNMKKKKKKKKKVEGLGGGKRTIHSCKQRTEHTVRD